MDLDRQICDRARRARDPRFDGKFFIAVTSTRIYCRPICPARSPKDEHVHYFPTAAAAAAAGYRPCLRCRPEAAPGSPAWLGTSSLVSRALRLIGDGLLDRDRVDGLADRLGVTSRHLRRLFLRHLGATPLDVALTRRIHFAKRLLDDTRLPMHEVAIAAGFGSVRRFNGEMQRTYHRTPTQLRRLARRREPTEPGSYRLLLHVRAPYDWAFVLRFLEDRVTPGVECVADGHYRRTLCLDGRTGEIDVSWSQESTALALDVKFPDPRALLVIVERVRRMFDVSADPSVIAAHLGGDPLLSRPLAAHPGIRTPGAWDGFELAVHAILGQQSSARNATTLAGRVAMTWGAQVDGSGGLSRLFPSPAELANAPLEAVGVLPSRADAIRRLARRVIDGAMRFEPADGLEGIRAALAAIPGIGEWTAAYVAMRAFNEPDAFLAGDRLVRKMMGLAGARQAERRAEAWRPWRAYAVMLLWQAAHAQSAARGAAHHGSLHAHVAPSAVVVRRDRAGAALGASSG